MKTKEAFLMGYELLSIPIIDSDGVPAWVEKFPLEQIERIRETVGARHFASQMMLNPASIEKARLDASALHFYNDEFDIAKARLGDILINGIALYWDPSSAHKQNDASVCVLVLRDDRTRRAFIHDCVYLTTEEQDAHPLATQCAKMLEFMRHHEIQNIAIEVNGIGNALPEILQREATQIGQAVKVQKVINHENKAKRILDAIEPLLGTGRLYAHENIKNTELIDEMNDWTPLGWMHDDGIDAVAGALRLQPVPIRARNTTIRPIHAKTDFTV